MTLTVYAELTYLKQMAKQRLDNLSKQLEKFFNADVVFFCSQIETTSAQVFNEAIIKLAERTKSKSGRLVVVFKSYGGEPDMAINIIENIRRFYKHVIFIVPEIAVSAGTLISLSANELYMNKKSALGSLDLQLTFPHGNYSLSALNERIKKGRKLIEEDVQNKNPLSMHERNVITQIEMSHKLIEENQWQEKVRQCLTQNLKRYMFVDFDSLSAEEKEKVESIANKLIDEHAMHKSGTYFHNNYLFIEKIIEMGIKVKDYTQELQKISSEIDEFHALCVEYKYIQTFETSFVFYNRLVLDIPLVQKQQNVGGEVKSN